MPTESPQERIDRLRDAIRHHEERYYIHNAPEISDEAFDQLLHELERRGAKRGLATLCVSGGMGMALAIVNAA